MGEDCFIGAVGVRWEAAFASLYRVEVSDNGNNWTTVATVTGTNGYVLTEAGVNGRYVRIYGVERATGYGISMYELEVFGVRSSLGPNDVLGLDITPKVARMSESESLQLTAAAYNKNGGVVNTPITWSVASGPATVSANGLLTPNGYGTVVVSATAAGTTASQTILVEEGLKVKRVEITPAAVSLVSGGKQAFTAVAYDQFGGAVENAVINYQLVGNGSSFAGDTFTAGNQGDYQLIANCGGIKDTAYVKVTTLGNINLALHKHTSCSSFEGGGTLASNVNDGDYITRWGSTFRDGEYVEIDLEGYYNINQINIFWQEAYATEYHVEVSMDEERWTTVYATKQGHGGDESLAIDETAARYVRLTADKRYNAGWGVSVREIEVYGTSTADAPYPVEIELLPPYVFYLGTPVRLQAQVINQYGEEMKQDPLPVFSVNGGGTVDEYGMFTPTAVGDWVVSFNFRNQISNICGITVKAPQQLSSIIVVPGSSLTTVGAQVPVTAYGFDQYGNSMEIEPAWTTTLGNITAAGVFSSNAVGTATVTARVGNVQATGSIQVVNALVNNLALNKPAVASSGNAAAAVDGNPGSRWESQFSDPQWLYVDLQDVYQLTSMEILWETASAKDYDIQVSNDAQNWVTILEMNDMPAQANRVDNAVLGGVGRYVRVYGKHRTTNYGHSIFEFRLYGAALPAGQPYSIEFVAPQTDIKTRITYQYNVVVRDKNGTVINNPAVVWSATGGSINQAGEYMASEQGTQTITATVGNVKAALSLDVHLNVGVETAKEAVVWWREGDLLIAQGASLQRISLYDAAGRLLARTSGASRLVLPVNGRSGLGILLIEESDGSRKLVKICL